MAEVQAEKNAEKAALGAKVANSSATAVLEQLWYGTPLRLPSDQVQPYLHATMSVAGVDKIHASEAQWLHDRTLLLGLSEHERDALFALDLHPSKVDPVIQSLLEQNSACALSAALFYDALTMATQDNFSLDERLRAGRVAQVLRLSDDEAEAIESIVQQEEALRKRKQALFLVAAAAGDSDSFTSEKEMDTAASFASGKDSDKDSFTSFHHPHNSNGNGSGHGLGFFSFLSERLFATAEPYNEEELASRPRRHALHRLTYGTRVPLVEQRNRQYVASLLAVASAEGTVSQAERAWVQDRCTVLELGQDCFSLFFDAIEPDGSLRTAALKESAAAVEALPGDAVARAVLYDAVTMAAQHGMSDVKRERSRRVAAQLGLAADVCAEVFEIVGREIALRKTKSSLFAPAATKNVEA